MGYDQGNVPLGAVHRAMLSRLPLRPIVLSLPIISLLGGFDTKASDDLPTRCGFHEASHHRFSVQPGQPPRLQSDRPTGLDEFVEDPDGRFRVHFTRVGTDAVPLTDDDGNGIPDYVDVAVESLLHALNIQVNEAGLRPPPLDNGAGGSRAIDVYLRDLSRAGSTGSGMYGITRPDELIAAGTTTSRYTSFMEIDNNFSPLDTNRQGRSPYATYGTDALRATCAHELHHVIQIGSYSFGTQEQMIYEMWATWIELRCYPTIRDWTVYLNALLQRPDSFPFSRTTASNGYAWGWFGNVLALDGGDAPMRRTWERVAAGERPYQALINACRDVGPDFTDRFCRALNVLYHTGQRGLHNDVLPHATALREITLAVDDVAQRPSTIASITLRPFEVGAMRWTVPGAESPSVVSLLLTNTNINAISSPNDESSIYGILLSERSQQGMPINGTAWSINVTGPSHCVFLDGISTRAAGAPFPMPVKIGVHTTMYLPFPDGLLGDEATVRIYNPAMALLHAAVVTLSLRGSAIVAATDVPPSLRPGVYIAVIDVGGTTLRHKVVVE